MPSLTTAPYIPFIRTQGERDVAQQVMSNVELVRCSAEFASSCSMSPGWRLWLDPSFDGYDDMMNGGWTSNKSELRGWEQWIRTFPHYQEPTNRNAADKKRVSQLVHAALSNIVAHKPAAITVPQMTYDASTDSHNINEILAKTAAEWKLSNWTTKGIFILPVVVTDYEVYRTKSKGWGRKINLIQKLFEASRASAVWVVHAKFDDLCGTSSLDKEEFPKLVEFHHQLKSVLPPNTTILAGPYWAINLILWARGYVDIPTISCGSGYKYYPPTRFRPQPKNRIALPSLRRWYSAKPELGKWIRDAKHKFPPHSAVRVELEKIESQFASFIGQRGRRPSMLQSATFYEDWIQQIAAVQPAGRALFMFQDFSSALVTGSQIKILLPKDGALSAEARKPGAAAQQFMLQCLPR
ncbi:MAG: hypothetical protein IT445_06290 [Phycisphaeraceae bacterium]|nr:hypothetical protein [Phycisphaeraceae bacterium]